MICKDEVWKRAVGQGKQRSGRVVDLGNYFSSSFLFTVDGGSTM